MYETLNLILNEFKFYIYFIPFHILQDAFGVFFYKFCGHHHRGKLQLHPDEFHPSKQAFSTSLKRILIYNKESSIVKSATNEKLIKNLIIS